MKQKIPVFILGLLTVYLFSACTHKEVQKIQQKENGFELYRLFDKEEELVLGTVKNTIGEPILGYQLDKEGCDIKTYGGLKESKYGMEYDLGLQFVKEHDDNVYVFASYNNTIRFDDWPDDEERVSIQKVFDELISLYGDPDHVDHIPDMKDIFADDWKHDKYAEWDVAHASFSFIFDQPTQKGSLSISFESSQFVEEHEDVFNLEYKYY